MRLGIVDELDPAAALAMAAADLGLALLEVVGGVRIAQANAAAEWLTGIPKPTSSVAIRPTCCPRPRSPGGCGRPATRRASRSGLVRPNAGDASAARDGQRAIVTVTVHPIEDRAGCCILSLRRSEIARVADERLTRSEARFRALIDGAPQPIWVLDRDRVLYANRACQEQFEAAGYQAEGWPDPRAYLTRRTWRDSSNDARSCAWQRSRRGPPSTACTGRTAPRRCSRSARWRVNSTDVLRCSASGGT
jgi:PAS domain-containing protein